jgi:hypothetical protein
VTSALLREWVDTQPEAEATVIPTSQAASG